MTKVLLIGSSALGDASVSKQVAEALLEELRCAEPDLQLTTRDVGSEISEGYRAPTGEGSRPHGHLRSHTELVARDTRDPRPYTGRTVHEPG